MDPQQRKRRLSQSNEAQNDICPSPKKRKITLNYGDSHNSKFIQMETHNETNISTIEKMPPLESENMPPLEAENMPGLEAENIPPTSSISITNNVMNNCNNNNKNNNNRNTNNNRNNEQAPFRTIPSM